MKERGTKLPEYNTTIVVNDIVTGKPIVLDRIPKMNTPSMHVVYEDGVLIHFDKTRICRSYDHGVTWNIELR